MLAPSCYAVFTTASVGMIPCTAYRHKAMTNLRASATIPIRRSRLPRPKRSRYQQVSALAGCQRTQFQASWILMV